jgi:hypothetical protein
VTQHLRRTALSHCIFTGLQRHRLGALIAELAGVCMTSEEGWLHERRGHDRLRLAGGGAQPRAGVRRSDHRDAGHPAFPAPARGARRPVRRGPLHDHPGRPRDPPAARRAGLRRARSLRHAASHPGGHVRLRRVRGVEVRWDGTEVQVRRPRANKSGRRVFISGKKKQNTKKATVITDGRGRTLWAGGFDPAACMTRRP